ncbi:MAG: histidine phosphatase family protein [Parcubacteria group bacterium]|nr:histidine phosphatase family protein [Parcubacteria group bacterium]
MAQFVFVRHGNTTKAERNEDRVLTEVGKLQALGFWTRCDELGLLPFDLVLTSPTTRAKQTAAIIAPDAVTIALPELGTEIPGEDGARLNKVYSRLKYAPLTEYLKEPGIGDILSRYVQIAALAIGVAMAKTGMPYQRVLVVGHAVLLNAIGAGGDKFNAGGKEILLSFPLGECEGFYSTGYKEVELIRNIATS